MLSFDEFEEILMSLTEEIPEKYYVDLNGGVHASPEWRLHPKSRGCELSVLGEYHLEYGLGRFIVLYYGSFQHVFPGISDEMLRIEMKKVLEHELTHHLESLAGEKDLEVLDAVRLMQYMETGRTAL